MFIDLSLTEEDSISRQFQKRLVTTTTIDPVNMVGIVLHEVLFKVSWLIFVKPIPLWVEDVVLNQTKCNYHYTSQLLSRCWFLVKLIDPGLVVHNSKSWARNLDWYVTNYVTDIHKLKDLLKRLNKILSINSRLLRGFRNANTTS